MSILLALVAFGCKQVNLGATGPNDSLNASAIATPAPEPQGFLFRNGFLLRWGSTQADLKNHQPRRSHIRASEFPSKPVDCETYGCSVTGEILPSPYSAASLNFEKGRFYDAYITFHPLHFDEVGAALETALKQPPLRESGTVQNGFGATFDQEKLSWRTRNVGIVLKKLCGNIYESCLDIEYEPIAEDVPQTEDPAKAPF
jgi:hypothetical protein